MSRDGYLCSADFLEADKYPEMVFRSTRVVRTGKTKAKLHGDLTIRDVTEPVVLDVTYLGSSKSPSDTSKVGFEASAKVNREDWDLTWNAAVETGGWLVGKDITIHIEAEFTKQDESTKRTTQ